MKQFKYFFILITLSLSINSCVVEDGENPFYGPDAFGVYPVITDIVNGFFDIIDPSTAMVSFTVNPSESGGAIASGSGEVRVSFNGGDFVKMEDISAFPFVGTYTLNETAAVVGASPENLTLVDSFRFRFYFDLTNGQRMTSGNFVNVPMNCASKIAGTHTYVSSNLQASNGYPCPVGDVTGTVTFTDKGGGSYLVSDLGFGQYPSSCWNDTEATSSNAIISDSCNKLISGGLDQYGLTYIWVITDVSGPELSISWSNDYGDSGDVVITREGGLDWPDLYTE